MFINKNLNQHILSDLKLASSNENKIENIWFEVTKNKNKYTIGGVYRHPNQNISIFKHYMDELMAEIMSRRLTCIIAGHKNIDLTKCE
jgi:hypothetical protein